MADLTSAASAWLATHHGVIDTVNLRRLGVKRSTWLRLVERGVFVTPFKGVYVLASSAPTLEQRLVSLCAAHRRGFVTGPTAGHLLGLRRMPRHSSLHFCIAHDGRLDAVPGVRFRQTNALLPTHSCLRADGIRLAAPPRLAFDLAADLPPLDHLSVLHQLLDRRLLSGEDLVAIGRRLCHPARPGSKRFAAALTRLAGKAAASQSHDEVTLLEALRDRNVPVVPQVEVECDSFVAHIDLAVAAVGWGIELDLHPEHRTIDGHGRDSQRYRELHRRGWTVEPVAELDLADPERLADELAAMYRQHCDRHDLSGGLRRDFPDANPPTDANPPIS